MQAYCFLGIGECLREPLRSIYKNIAHDYLYESPPIFLKVAVNIYK